MATQRFCEGLSKATADHHDFIRKHADVSPDFIFGAQMSHAINVTFLYNEYMKHTGNACPRLN